MPPQLTPLRAPAAEPSSLRPSALPTIVVANYRLGFLGWLGSWQLAALDARNSTGTSGCLATLLSCFPSPLRPTFTSPTSPRTHPDHLLTLPAGNVGLQDQRLALQWANKNAHVFGGDKTRLLLFGESAGAAATAMHMLSQPSHGLFTRAAMQSGAFVPWASKSLHTAQVRAP
jgi:para-nitrobenzyl esterase